MGMFDTVKIEEGIELPDWPYDTKEVDWQSKSIGRPSMDTYKITEDGRLLKKEVEREELSEDELEDRANEHGFDSWDELVEESPMLSFGTTKVVGEWWEDQNRHGSFKFSATHPREKTDDSVEGVRHTYEAVFRDGDLTDIALLDRHEL